MEYTKLIFTDLLTIRNSIFTFSSDFVRYIDEYPFTREELENYDCDFIFFVFKGISISGYFSPLKYWKNIWYICSYNYDYWGYREYNFQCPWCFLSVTVDV